MRGVFAEKALSKLIDDQKIENYKYDARLSTFQLNLGEADIVFLGDSITAYIDWNEFFKSSNLLNRGVEGDTWRGVLHRLDEIISRHPSTIVLMVGINDIAAGAPSDEIIEQARETINKIDINLSDTQIILCDIIPSPKCSLKAISEVNTGYLNIDNEDGSIIHLPLMDLYLNEDGSANANLFSNDGIHLNGNGYKIWIEELRKISIFSR